MKCKWIDHHISMDTYGGLRPCCNFRTDKDVLDLFSIGEYQSSPWLKKISNTLLLGQWPDGCKDCKEEEELGIESLRVESFKKYKNKKRDAEVKFGNLCNLACVMCSPTNSSLIDQETKLLQKTESNEFIQTRPLYKKTLEWYKNDKLLEEVAEFLSDRDQIRFTGGEPTVNNYLIKFLDVLIKLNSKAELRITTNGNSWPKSLHEKLLNFNVNVDVSIDEYDYVNEYIRWPSNWKKIKKNLSLIKQISNITSCYTTVSCYNVHTLPELCNWVQKEFDNHILNPVSTPSFMNPAHANQYSKDIFTELCNWYEPANKIKSAVLKSGDVTNLKKVTEYFTVLDKKRKTDLNILGTKWRQYD